jgi:hypothetical protein
MVPSWWDTPSGEGENGRWIRQVSVETLGSGVSAVMCVVRVNELLKEGGEGGNEDG